MLFLNRSLVLLGALVGAASALESTHSLQSRVQAQGQLRQRLQELKPQQQQDLAVVVPVLQKGNKAAFKARLAEMVNHGGSERIKECLQGLASIGFDALEIQSWLQKEWMPVPRSKLVPETQKKAEQAAPQSAADVKPAVEEKRVAQPAPAQQLRASSTAMAAVAALKPKETAAEPVARELFTTKDTPVEASVMSPIKPAAPAPEAVVGAMAGAAAEQQLAAGKMKHELKKEEDQQKSKAKAEEKANLRKELAKRLAKGVQALQRVTAVEKNEAELKQQISGDESRIAKLEEALKVEAEQMHKEQDENVNLRQELVEQEQLSKKTESRLDALEKFEKEQDEKVSKLAAAKPQEQSGGVPETRVAALEEENVKFRAALAGAARRLINLEAEVTNEKQQTAAQPQGPKVIRHEKLPLQPAA